MLGGGRLRRGGDPPRPRAARRRLSAVPRCGQVRSRRLPERLICVAWQPPVAVASLRCSRGGAALPPTQAVEGTARLGRRTKDLVKRLAPGDIAVIDHLNIDRIAAEELIATGVRGGDQRLASPPTAATRTPGPLLLARAGVLLIDVDDGDPFELLRDGERLRIEGGDRQRRRQAGLRRRRARRGRARAPARRAARAGRRGARRIRREHRRPRARRDRPADRRRPVPADPGHLPRPPGADRRPRRPPPPRHQGAARLHPRRPAARRLRRRRRRRGARGGAEARRDPRRHGLGLRRGAALRRRADRPRLSRRPRAGPRAAAGARPRPLAGPRRRGPARTSRC